jgi:hypothetical protein
MNHLLQLAASDNAPGDVASIAQVASFDSPAADDLNDRYADSILLGCECLYDSLEVQGVRDLLAGTGTSETQFEVDNLNPQQFSVYAHYIEGGSDAVGDFGTYALAMQYARELNRKYGWPVRDYVLDEHKTTAKLQ